jgi:hypothetical protein
MSMQEPTKRPNNQSANDLQKSVTLNTIQFYEEFVKQKGWIIMNNVVDEFLCHVKQNFMCGIKYIDKLLIYVRDSIINLSKQYVVSQQSIDDVYNIYKLYCVSLFMPNAHIFFTTTTSDGKSISLFDNNEIYSYYKKLFMELYVLLTYTYNTLIKTKFGNSGFIMTESTTINRPYTNYVIRYDYYQFIMQKILDVFLKRPLIRSPPDCIKQFHYTRVFNQCILSIICSTGYFYENSLYLKTFKYIYQVLNLEHSGVFDDKYFKIFDTVLNDITFSKFDHYLTNLSKTICVYNIEHSCDKLFKAVQLFNQPAIPVVIQSATQPVVQSATQPVVQPVTHPVVQGRFYVQSETQPVVQSATQPVVQPVTPVVQPVTQSVVQSETQPVVQPVIQPVVQSETQPVVQPVTQPVVQPVTPVVQPVTHPVVQPVTHPVVQPVTPVVIQSQPSIPAMTPVVTQSQPAIQQQSRQVKRVYLQDETDSETEDDVNDEDYNAVKGKVVEKKGRLRLGITSVLIHQIIGMIPDYDSLSEKDKINVNKVINNRDVINRPAVIKKISSESARSVLLSERLKKMFTADDEHYVAKLIQDGEHEKIEGTRYLRLIREKLQARNININNLVPFITTNSLMTTAETYFPDPVKPANEIMQKLFTKYPNAYLCVDDKNGIVYVMFFDTTECKSYHYNDGNVPIFTTNLNKVPRNTSVENTVLKRSDLVPYVSLGKITIREQDKDFSRQYHYNKERSHTNMAWYADKELTNCKQLS